MTQTNSNTQVISLKKATEELANLAGAAGRTYCTIGFEMGTHDCIKVDKVFTVEIRIYIDGFGSFKGSDLDELMCKVRDSIYGVKQTISDVEL